LDGAVEESTNQAVKATPDRHLKPFWRKNRDGLMKTMKPVKTARFFALKFNFQIL
jgi:hypothetical protein